MADKYQLFISCFDHQKHSTFYLIKINFIVFCLFLHYSQPVDMEGAMKYSPKKGAYTKVRGNSQSTEQSENSILYLSILLMFSCVCIENRICWHARQMEKR